MRSINKQYTDQLEAMNLSITFSKGMYTIVDKVAQEGIILSCENEEYIIDNFTFINGEQMIGEASSDNIFDAINYLEDALNIGAPASKAEITTPDKREVEDVIENVETALSVMQDNITIDAVSAHPGAIKVLLTLQKTPKAYIKSLKVANAKGSKPAVFVPYVDGQYMTRALNFAFLFDWSFEVPETRQDGEFFTALGLLTVNLDGKTITKSQWGSQKMRAGMELGDALKGATTDALKKCASMFGIAADVYAGEV